MDVKTPALYFDLGSPYAYLALERVQTLLGRAPECVPVLLGAIFRWRGYGSWAGTPQRGERIAEIEDRARGYGLPPLVWPATWPVDGLAAMRAASWAAQQGRAAPFAREVFRAQFGHGADIADLRVLAGCAQAAGLDAGALAEAIATAEIKDRLRHATRTAWEAGVQGVPSLRIGRDIFYGDDRLEAAAARLPA